MWLSNSRNQFIRSGFEHAGQNEEGAECEEKRYLYANESWMKWSGRMELNSVLLTGSHELNAWNSSVSGQMVSTIESLNLASQPRRSRTLPPIPSDLCH